MPPSVRNTPTALSFVGNNAAAPHVSEFNAALQKYTVRAPEYFALSNALTYRMEGDDHAVIMSGEKNRRKAIFRYYNPETNLHALHPELGDGTTRFNFQTQQVFGKTILVYRNAPALSDIAMQTGRASRRQ